MTDIIPFPSGIRVGHARKIAIMLKRARSEREAYHIIRRAISTFERQMAAAAIPEEGVSRERHHFLLAIDRQCRQQGSKWTAVSPIAIDRDADRRGT